MYLESLVSVTQTEEKIKQAKIDAALAAKKRIADTTAEGETLITDAVKKADGELRELNRNADEKVRSSIKELAASNENKKAMMAAKAESRMDKAAGFIVERIVNS